MLRPGVDYATDSVIQESLRRELDKGVTLLTIAHRLQTIMDSDKIVSILERAGTDETLTFFFLDGA